MKPFLFYLLLLLFTLQGPIVLAQSNTSGVISGIINSVTNGEGNISFFTADKPGSYTLLIEGCDMNGNIESTRQKIIVR